MSAISARSRHRLWHALNEKLAADEISDLLALVPLHGTDTVPNAATTVVVTVGAEYDGAYPVVGFAEAPTAATIVSSSIVAAGDFTITIDQNNTADLLVAYSVQALA